MAGILPYTHLDNGEPYFLFARERINNNPACSDRGLWCDFGGSRNKGETLLSCAIREGAEELCGFLSKQFIKDNICGKQSIKRYTTFFVRLSYSDHRKLPDYLNAHYKFMAKNSTLTRETNTGLYEKDEFAWFSLKDIREKREEFRPFYREMLDLIVADFSK